MSSKQNLYLKLFLSTLKISAFTFGGGFVILPLMRKRFVEELKWIESQEMLDLMAIAQSSPGAIAVNASILVGYRVAGICGAFITVFGTVLPPLIIISVISFFYKEFRQLEIMNIIMSGMLAGVAAVVCDVVITMTEQLLKHKKVLPILLLMISFIAIRCFDMNIIIVILLCGIIGILKKEQG